MDAAELFRRHHLPIFRYLLRMTGNRDLAEELTQEVFLRVTRSLKAYEDRGRIEAWLFSIARNLMLNQRRNNVRHPAETSLDEREHPRRPHSPLEGLALQEALGDLAEGEREAFLLRELAGLGYAEIAELTDTSPDAVRSRIYRARTRLRESLKVGGPRALPREERS